MCVIGLSMTSTFIIIVKNIQGFDKKPKLTKELFNPNNLSVNTNNTMILYFSYRCRDILMFLRVLDQGPITEV